jgi:hypothetical protein
VSEELRDLERAVVAGGGAQERLKLARALERLGRSDEAREVLVPARADVDVRRELGRFPAWTHPEADAGATNYIDVEPIRTKPVVKWSKPIPFSPDAVLANELAVVATNREKSCALDPETGEILWDTGQPAVATVGDVVFARSRAGVVGIDISTGAVLHETELAPQSGFAVDSSGLLCVRERNRIADFSIEDPRVAPSLRREAVMDRLDGVPHECLLSTDRVVLVIGGQFLIDRGALTLVARIRGFASRRLDHSAFAFSLGNDTACLDPDTGREVWRGEMPLGSVAALTPSLVIARWAAALVFLRRQDGTRAHPDLATWITRVAIARDVLYAWNPGEPDGDDYELEAHAVGGPELWRLPQPSTELPSIPIYGMAAAPRRLYCAAGRNTVFCLEAPP